MADEKEAPKPADAKAAAPKKGGKLGLILFMVVFGASFWFIFPTFILILVGMVPTCIAILADTDDQKSGAVAVGAMNGAGLAPFIIDLWSKGQTMEHLFQILREPSNWMVIAGAAGIGWLIVFAMPQALASLAMARAESRLKILRQNLDSLKTTWGPDVATTKSIDKIAKAE
ncbi:MAG: hypothetical protein SFW62_00540 [Alphaproteobacteria bacterium]|nr:hypothetical protein [Alphaproteobacteria bacterium]